MYVTIYIALYDIVRWMCGDGILGGFSICPPDISTTSVFNYPHYTFNYNHNCYNNSSHLIQSGGVSKFTSNNTDFVSTQFSFFSDSHDIRGFFINWLQTKKLEWKSCKLRSQRHLTNRIQSNNENDDESDDHNHEGGLSCFGGIAMHNEGFSY